MQWVLLDPSDPEGIEWALTASRKVAGEAGLGARAFDLDWRRGPAAEWSTLRIFTLGDSTGAHGMAVFSRTKLPLKFAIGEVAVARLPLVRHWHLGEPYLPASLTDEEAVATCAELLRAAIAALAPTEALFFEGLPQGGPLHRALQLPLPELGARSVALQLGKPYEHQFIDMPASYADYLTQLGSRSRQSVLYSTRRLSRDMDGDVHCECFELPDAVDRFVTDATAISRKTYQWNLLGLGLRDAEGLTTTLRFAATRGWMRCFILYCRGTPVAFMLGYQQGAAYYYDDVGFDPAYGRWSVGSVLQIQVLEMLLARPDRPRYFDFSTGYGEHKGRFGNRSRPETNLLVFPFSWRTRLVARAYRLCESTSSTASRLVAALGIKERLRKLIRRRATATGETAQNDETTP